MQIMVKSSLNRIVTAVAGLILAFVVVLPSQTQEPPPPVRKKLDPSQAKEPEPVRKKLDLNKAKDPGKTDPDKKGVDAKKQNDDTSLPIDRAILRRLRQRCATQSPLKGIAVEDVAEGKKGVLVLRGAVDNEDQRQHLVKYVEGLLADNPAWRGRFPGGADAKSMKIVPVRSVYLKKIKKDLFTNQWADEDQSLFAKMRLDDVHYHPETLALVFEGICIARTAEKVPEGKDTRLHGELVRLRSALNKLLKEYTASEEGQGIVVDVGAVLLANPLPAFQESLTGQRIYEVFFHKARFTEDGTLLLEGWAGNPLRPRLDKLFADHCSKHPVLAVNPKWSLTGMRFIDWPLQAAKWNTRLAGDTEGFRHAHVRRMYFGYSADGGAELRVDGYFSKDDKLQDKVGPRLRREWEADWNNPELLKFPLVTRAFKYEDHVTQLQHEVTEVLGLDDVLIEKAGDGANGVYHVGGLTGTAEHGKTVEQHVRKKFAEGPAPSVKDLRVEKWGTTLAGIQRALAISSQPALRSLRLDRLFFGFTPEGTFEVRLAGLTLLDLSDDDKALTKERLRKELEGRIPALAEHVGQVSVDYFTPLLAPERELQVEAIGKLGLRDVAITRAAFDADGVLVFEGRVGSKESLAALTKWLTAKYAGDARLAPRDNVASWSLAGLRTEDWSGRLKILQARLAEGPEDICRQTRLDHLGFGLTADNAVEVRLGGICLLEHDGELLRTRLQKEWNQLWPGTADRLISVKDIVTIARPEPAVRDHIAKFPALDGIRLDAKSVFDADGSWVLAGVWCGPLQEKELRSQIGNVYMADPTRPDERGVDCRQLQIVRTDLLLRDLRKFAADYLEDVRVDRLYFDKTGKLRLQGVVTSAEDEKALYGQLEKLLKVTPGGKLVGRAAPTRPMLVAALQLPPEQPEVPGLQTQASLAKFLREQVLSPLEPGWDGVYIERGIYAQDGTYVLRGLVDNDGQKRALDLILKELGTQPEWLPALPKGGTAQNMVTLPVQPMLDAIAELMPEYTAFDRLRLDRAYYTGKTLVLAGFTTADDKNAKDKAEKLLTRLLGHHPLWKVRLGKGLTLNVEAMVPDDRIATLAIGKAVQLLQDHLPETIETPPQQRYQWQSWGCAWVLVSVPAKSQPKSTPAVPPAWVLDKVAEHVSVALLHAPDNSTAWFLRGAVTLAKGNQAIAGRDLRRMMAVEWTSPYARAVRLEKLEHVQGEFRRTAAAMAENVTLDMANGRRPWTLVEITARYLPR